MADRPQKGLGDLVPSMGNDDASAPAGAETPGTPRPNLPGVPPQPRKGVDTAGIPRQKPTENPAAAKPSYGQGLGANTGSPVDDILTDLEDSGGQRDDSGQRRPNRRTRDDRDNQPDTGRGEGADEPADQSEPSEPNDVHPERPLETTRPDEAEPEKPGAESGSGEPGEGPAGAGEGGLGGAEAPGAGAGMAEGGAAGGEGAAAGAGTAAAGAGAEGAATAGAEAGAMAAEAGAAAAAEGTAAVAAATSEVWVPVLLALAVIILCILGFLAIGGSASSAAQTASQNGGAASGSAIGGPVSGNIQQMSQQIVQAINGQDRSHHITQPYKSSTGNTVKVLSDVAAGSKFYTTCPDAGAPPVGTKVDINPNILKFVLAASTQTTVGINAITDKCHTAGSAHYSGEAIDLENGAGDLGTILRVAGQYGGSRNSETSHIHLDFPKH